MARNPLGHVNLVEEERFRVVTGHCPLSWNGKVPDHEPPVLFHLIKQCGKPATDFQVQQLPDLGLDLRRGQVTVTEAKSLLAASTCLIPAMTRCGLSAARPILKATLSAEKKPIP